MGRLSVIAVDQRSSEQGHSSIHWVLLVDPRKQHGINIGTKPYAFDLSNGSSRHLAHPDGVDHQTLLRFHVAKLKQSSLSQVRQNLEHIAGSTSESWLAGSLASLQDAGLIGRFSISKFLQFAKDAVSAHRISHDEQVEEIDYTAILDSNQQVKQMLTRVQDDNEEAMPAKKSFLGFWVSRPGNPWEQQEIGGYRRSGDPYGGLM